MKSVPLLAAALATLMLAGCGGTYTVTRMHGKPPEQLRSVAIAPQSGNSAEVTGYVSEALAARGVEVRGEVASAGFRSEYADGVVSYSDVWRWDLAMYLQSIKINLYNASSGALLVSGRWEDSFFHAYHRGDSVSKELLTRMFAELEVPVGGMQASPLTAQPVAAEVSVRQPSAVVESQGAAKAVGGVSRNEYAAREQAKLLNCPANEVLSIEGLGSPREELTFSCGDGRRVTIVCRTAGGCS